MSYLDELRELKKCFNSDFTQWLLATNNQKIGRLEKFEIESLSEIFLVLLENPDANWFWYTYPQHGGKLTWISQKDLERGVSPPKGVITINTQKIKRLFRNIKLTEILEDELGRNTDKNSR